MCSVRLFRYILCFFLSNYSPVFVTNICCYHRHALQDRQGTGPDYCTEDAGSSSW